MKGVETKTWLMVALLLLGLLGGVSTVPVRAAPVVANTNESGPGSLRHTTGTTGARVGIAGVSASGKVTGTMGGTTQVIESLGGAAGSAGVRVTGPTLIGIAPASAPAGRAGNAGASAPAAGGKTLPAPLPTGR